MKRIIIFIAFTLTICISCKKDPIPGGGGVVPTDTASVSQILNGGFECWEGSGKELEPCHWNSYMSADGSGLAFMAGKAQQVDSSSDVRPGSDGRYSVCVYARSVLGVVANGNLTTGRVYIGSTSVQSKDNFNFSACSLPDFHQSLTAKPEAIRFWAKFDCPDAAQYARMSAIIHDLYDYRDPEVDEEASHAVGKAVLEFTAKSGGWYCYTVPFEYGNPTNQPKYILISFTTNRDAGKGSGKDRLYLDDVELLYAVQNR
jgi:hypothetical protein